MERTTSKFLSCAPGWMVAPLVGWRKDGKLAVVGSGGGGDSMHSRVLLWPCKVRGHPS